jgi:16S rRNA (cytidine1402-2'-O)-methyltransferase
MGALYVTATPIGNLSDITYRAIEVLEQVDLIACEDTRHTATLLQRYGIKTPTVSYHQHSTLQKIDWIVDQLKFGKEIAMVTDAGTPGISDPGGVLVEKIHHYNAALHGAAEPIAIISIPGPSSAMAALSVSGFPADSFKFLGFLPKKKGRQTLLRALPQISTLVGGETFVFFESNHRIQQSLQDFIVIFGSEAEVCLCRELTKKFEEIWRGTLAEALAHVTTPQKGEFVVVLRINK